MLHYGRKSKIILEDNHSFEKDHSKMITIWEHPEAVNYG
jgi:hypothetical protein